MNAAEEAIRFHCLGCKRVLLVSLRRAGHRVRCPACQAMNLVPDWDWDREREGYPVPSAEGPGPEPPPIVTDPRVSPAPPRRITPPQPVAERASASAPDKPGAAGPPAPREYIPVVCGVCHTRMSATLEEVGHELECPDCGTKCKVPPPPRKRSRLLAPDVGPPVALAAPIVAPEIDYLAEPERVPLPDAGVLSRLKREEIAAEAERNRGKLYALLVGYWLATSVIVMGALAMVLIAASTSIDNIGGAFAAPVLAVLAALASIGAASFVSVFLLRVLENAAEQAPLEDDMPAWYAVVDWLLGGRFVVWAVVVSAAPGGILDRLLALVGLPGWFCMPLSLLALFPPVLGAILVSGSLGGVFCGEMWATLRNWPGKWAQFYVESLGIGAACFLALVAGLYSTGSVWGMLPAAPFWMAAAILYFRRLGLLLDELPVLEEDDREADH